MSSLVGTEKRAKEIKDLHNQVRARIEKANEHNKVQGNKSRRDVQFKPGHLAWIHLRKERFPSKRKSKLLPRSDGPFEVLEKNNPNAYKIDLPRAHIVSATFNVADLSPYFDEAEELPSLRTNSSHAREDDGDHLNHKSMSMHAQVSSKDTDFLVGYSEPTAKHNQKLAQLCDIGVLTFKRFRAQISILFTSTFYDLFNKVSFKPNGLRLPIQIGILLWTI